MTVPAQAGLRRVAGASAWLLADSLLRVVATALTTLWVAAALGPQAYGVLALAMAVLAVFLVIGTLGSELPALARLSRGEAPGPLLGAVMALRCGGALLALALAAPAAWALHHDESNALAATLVVSLAIMGYAPAVFDLWFRARVDVRGAVLARMGTTLLSCAAKWWVLAMGFGLQGIAWTVVLESALLSAMLAGAWLRSRPRQPEQTLHLDPGLAWCLLKEGTPFLGSALIAVIATRVDLLLLGLLSSAEQTGVYGLAQRATEVLAVLSVVLVDCAFPLLARRAAASPQALHQAGQLLFDLAAAAAWVMALLACLLAPFLALLLGKSYAAVVPVLTLLAWGSVGTALGCARQRWLAHCGLQAHAPALALLAAATGLALGLALVPRWGAFGAAWAALGASVAAGLVAPFFFAALRPIAAMQLQALWPWPRLWQQLRRSLTPAQVLT